MPRFEDRQACILWAQAKKEKAVWLSHEYYACDSLIDALSEDTMLGCAITSEHATKQVLTLIAKPLTSEARRRVYRYALENMPIYSIEQLHYISHYHMDKCRFASESYCAWYNVWIQTCNQTLSACKQELHALASNRLNGSLHCRLYASIVAKIVC